MNIRKATIVDAKGIAKVQIDSWRTTYYGIVPNEFLDAMSYEKQGQRWEKILPNSIVFVAENKAAEIIGFISGGKNRFEEYESYPGEIYAIYLLKEYQRSGIGYSLVKALTEELLQQNIDSMIVLVLEDNLSKFFYESLGGICIDSREDEIGGKKLTEIVYAWKNIKNI